MTFDAWYKETIGITVAEAQAAGVYDLRILRECWHAAVITEREEIAAEADRLRVEWSQQYPDATAYDAGRTSALHNLADWIRARSAP